MSPRTRTKVPKGPIAIRLEGIRADQGLSLNKFHAAVIAATGSSVTYRSVQRYHTDDVAPVQYLADVAETFEVSMDWLCRGLGPANAEPPEPFLPDRADDDSMSFAEMWAFITQPLSNSVDDVVQVAFLDIYKRVLAAMPFDPDTGQAGQYSLTGLQKLDVGRTLCHIVTIPADIVRGGLDEVPEASRIPYLRHSLEALRCIMAPVGSGLSYEQLMDDWEGKS